MALMTLAKWYISLDSDVEAQQETDNIAQCTIMHSNFSLCAKFVNYYAVKLHPQN